jgi:Uncharacterized protein conserved in bacteria (DUF2188)
MSRKVYRVLPTEGGNWQVRADGASRASAVEINKAQAIDRAVDLAKNVGHSQVVIHRGDGVIQSERTYGEDPRRFPG